MVVSSPFPPPPTTATSPSSAMSSKSSAMSILCRPDKKMKRSARSVHFPTDEAKLSCVVAEVPSCFEFSEEDKKNLWFTASDYDFSRSTARVIAKESERYGHSKNLDAVYQQAFQQEVQDCLNLWAFHGHSRRGLERWANTPHGNVRKLDQDRYMNGVLTAYQEIKDAHVQDGGSAATTNVEEERLREVSHQLSARARQFAKMMGDADAFASQVEFGMMSMRGSPVSPRTKYRNINALISKVGVPSIMVPGIGAAGHRRGSINSPGRRRRSSSSITAASNMKGRAGRVPRVA